MRKVLTKLFRLRSSGERMQIGTKASEREATLWCKSVKKEHAARK
jgi:hypothetical protein